MQQNTPAIIIGIVVLALVAGVGVFFGSSQNPASESNKLDSFAQCIKDSGTIFYGAFWCPHCQAQKKLFGGSAKLLPYVECSTPDGNGQLDQCKTKDVKNYPTWDFPDGTRQTGEVSLVALAEKTKCALPTE
jgi:thiol-disulfide isomerase/thioredoxin